MTFRLAASSRRLERRRGPAARGGGAVRLSAFLASNGLRAAPASFSHGRTACGTTFMAGNLRLLGATDRAAEILQGRRATESRSWTAEDATCSGGGSPELRSLRAAPDRRPDVSGQRESVPSGDPPRRTSHRPRRAAASAVRRHLRRGPIACRRCWPQTCRMTSHSAAVRKHKSSARRVATCRAPCRSGERRRALQGRRPALRLFTAGVHQRDEIHGEGAGRRDRQMGSSGGGRRRLDGGAAAARGRRADGETG